jgi:hypothetical protein
MRHSLLRLVVAVLCLATDVLAAGPVPAQQITWLQPNTSATTAQGYTYTLTLTEEGKAPRDIPVASVLCGGLTIHAECAVALPASAEPAIISGNVSVLRALDTAFPTDPTSSLPFTGDQGCIFRTLLYALNERGTAQSNKQNLTAVYAEFQTAKFRHVRTQPLPKGNQFQVIGDCAGQIVPWP